MKRSGADRSATSPTGKAGPRGGSRRRPIRFGTSGWRGVLGDEVTDERARALVRAIAAWFQERGARRRVLVGFDARFASERLAGLACRELAAAGLVPQLASGACPTPVVASSVAPRRAAGALIWTASHNPPHDHGLKLYDERGCIADLEASRVIERVAARELRTPPPAPDEGGGPRRRSTPRLDLTPRYLERLHAALDTAAIRGARPLIVYDAMHGVGGDVVAAALEGCGARVEGLRLEPDPRFGGLDSPDPTPERLQALARRVRKLGAACGVATDGDADRFAVVDERGRPLGEARAAALLVDHLAAGGRAGAGVVLTWATGTLVERVAEARGLATKRAGMGFKWLSRALIDGQAGVACDESGGFAWRPVGADKDGVAAAALVAEVAAAGPLSRTLRSLERRAGGALHAARDSRPSTSLRRRGLERLAKGPPARLGASRVCAVDARDGLRLAFEDGFAMLRASGTEARIRAYAEAPTARALATRTAALWRLLERAGATRAR